MSVALGVVEHLLVGPATGTLHPGRQPVQAHRLAGVGHLRKVVAQVGEGGDKGPVGLAVAERGQWAQQQVQAVADLGLGDPHHPAGPPIRRPVQHHRGHGVQADLQGQRPGAAPPGLARRDQMGQAAGQPGEDLGG
jgi:hypothetical protein